MRGCRSIQELLVALTILTFTWTALPVNVGWAREDSFLRPAIARARDGGGITLTLQSELNPGQTPSHDLAAGKRRRKRLTRLTQIHLPITATIQTLS